MKTFRNIMVFVYIFLFGFMIAVLTHRYGLTTPIELIFASVLLALTAYMTSLLLRGDL